MCLVSWQTRRKFIDSALVALRTRPYYLSNGLGCQSYSKIGEAFVLASAETLAFMLVRDYQRSIDVLCLRQELIQDKGLKHKTFYNGTLLQCCTKSCAIHGTRHNDLIATLSIAFNKFSYAEWRIFLVMLSAMAPFFTDIPFHPKITSRAYPNFSTPPYSCSQTLD